jgi:hypothetical protein
MKLSEAVEKLNKLIDEGGDLELEIECTHPNGGFYLATPVFWSDSKKVLVREDLSEDQLEA